MQTVRFRIFRGSVFCKDSIKTNYFKLSNSARAKFHEDCYCRLTGKYYIPNFRYYCSSRVNVLSITQPNENNENIATPVPELVPEVHQVSKLSDEELMKLTLRIHDNYFLLRNNDPKGNADLASLSDVVDKECVNRAKAWDLNTTLQVAENYHPKAALLCRNLLFYLLKKKYKAALKSPVPTAIRYLQLMNSTRFWGAYYANAYLLEHTLAKRFDELTATEISVFLVAISLSEYHITSEELMAKILQKLLANIDDMSSIVLGKYLHFFSDQSTVRFRKLNFSLDQLLNHLPGRIPDFNCFIAGKVAMISAYQRVYHPELLDKIAEKLMNELPNVNPPPLEEIVTALVFFNYNSHDIYQKIIDNFEIEPLHTQLMEHPKRLIKIIYQLCLFGIHPYDYIDKVLSKDFLCETFGKKLTVHNVRREVLIINDIVELECPDYKGNRLDDFQETLRNYWCNRLHKCFSSNETVEADKTSDKKTDHELSSYNKTILEARDVLQSILGGPKFVHVCYIVPCLPRPNLVFFFDKQKNPINIPEKVRNSFIFDVQSVSQDLERYVVLPSAQHPFLKDNYMLLGVDIAKVRLLKKLGFHVVIVIEEIFNSMNKNEKRDYLKKLID